MTTSGTAAWALTARDVVKLALGELAILPPGSDPDADEMSDCIARLNGMLKSWVLKGVTLYREGSVDVTTTPGQPSVALPAGVRSVSSARVVNSATSERRLWPMGRDDYLALPNKAAVGSPTMFYLSRGRDGATLNLWPVSASALTIRLDYDRAPETVTDAGETIDIREELLETVYANLAVRINGLFSRTQPPPAELVARAQSLEQQMFDAERPDSYVFEYESNARSCA